MCSPLKTRPTGWRDAGARSSRESFSVLNECFRDICQFKVLTSAEERSLAIRIKNGDDGCADRADPAQPASARLGGEALPRTRRDLRLAPAAVLTRAPDNGVQRSRMQ